MNKTLDKLVGDYIQHDHIEVINNQTNINTISGDVIQNATDVQVVSSQVDTNSGNISDNDSDISYLSGVVSGNVLDINRSLGTGLIDIDLPGVEKLTVNTARVHPGNGYILDTSDPDNPSLTEVTWAQQDFTDSYVATNLRTAVGIDLSGTVQIFADDITAAQRRAYIKVGYLTHIDGATITQASLGPATAFDTIGKLNDVGEAIAGINLEGNIYSGYSIADMQLEKTSGSTFGSDRNYVNDKESPSVNNQSAVSPITGFFDAYRDGSGGQIVSIGTLIESEKYDNGTGVLATMTDGFWRTDRIYVSLGTGSTLVVKGQAQHPGKVEALTHLQTEQFSPLPGASLLQLRGYVSLRKGVTGLKSNDHVIFTPANKTGDGPTNRVENVVNLSNIAIKDYSFTSQGIGVGTYYIGGFYHAPLTDANLDEGSTTQAYGTSNSSYAAHAFIVVGGAGTATGGTGAVTITITGTSTTDAGVRTASDSETIVTDITTMITNDYYETSKKWVGTVTATLDVGATGHTAYTADFNYGLCKYEDFGNRDFMLQGFECVGLAGGTDSAFNITLLKHNDTGWTYSADAFDPGGDILCDMNTDHGTEQNLVNNEPFAYKRVPLCAAILGAASEGVVIKIDVGNNNSVQSMDVHLGAVV